MFYRAALLFCLASACLLSAPFGESSVWCARATLGIFHASFDGTLDAEGPNGPVKPLSVEGKVEYRPGRVGQALLCGGDAANVKYPVGGNLRARQGTIEMWVQPVDWPEKEQSFHVFFETEGPGWLVLYKFYTGGLLVLSGSDHAHFGSAMQDPFAFQNGQWYHLVGVWQRQRLALYVDGVLKKDLPSPALPESLQGFFRIGDDPWATPHASHTLIDEVKIYPYALSAAQIARAAQGQPVTDVSASATSIDVEPHPALGHWKVTVDDSLRAGGPEHSAKARIEVLGAGITNAETVNARGEVQNLKDGVGSILLDVTKVPAGAHLVRATMLDAAGQEIGRAETFLTKPADAPWTHSMIGMQNRVLPPFTEIRVGGVRAIEGRAPVGNAVECWGRKYRMDNVFPTQIESAGQPMLAGPIHLSASTQSGAVDFKKTAAGLAGWSPTRAQQTASASAPGFALKTQTSIEYDGFLWTEVTLSPQQSGTLTDLTLHIPLRAAVAKYVHHSRADWADDNAGALPPGGYESVAFQPYLWLGDEDRGLAWFAETQQGWSNASGKAVQSIVRNGDTVEMQIHLINQPTRLDQPLQFSFGLQATPVKPRPAGARGWRLNNLGTAENLKDSGMGNIQIIWSNGNLSYYGYPQPQDPAKFHKLVDDLHARHIRAVPYINLNFMSSGTPEFPYYSPDWLDPARSFNSGDVAAMGGATIGACPNVPAWRDFVAYKLAKFVDEYKVDGIYVDCWFPYGCLVEQRNVEDHDCGWRDAAGNLRPRYPMRGYREIMRRVRELFADRGPNFHIICHMSTDVIIPALAFADSMLDGEQYQGPKAPKDDYLSVIPLDKWRAENTGIQWGVVPFFLPEFTGDYRNSPVPTERLMGALLAHDANPWPIWCDTAPIFQAWKAEDKFGMADAQFLPYWKPNGVTSDNKDVIVSAYRKAGRAMLVVLNTGKADATANLTVDPQMLGLQQPALTAKNATDDAPIATANGSFKIAVPARNYRLVVVQ